MTKEVATYCLRSDKGSRFHLADYIIITFSPLQAIDMLQH